MAKNDDVRAALLGACLIVIAGCATAPPEGGAVRQDGTAPVKELSAPAKAASGYKFVCSCGPACDCDAHADKPGLCPCGKPLAYKKILREDSQYYWVCSCDACACDTISKEAPSRCSCGKDLQAVVKAGKYACSCPGCECNERSQKQGPCVCGTMMK